MGRIKSKHVAKFAYEKIICAAAAQIAPFLMADGATLTFVARKDGKVRG
jgi:hypothetical protein